VCLIEWPEQGAGFLPAADLHVYLRTANSGRRVQLVAGSARGEQVLRCLD
jgi:tRNA threonylcarbamoyladenosine biosynthesis protein TsaE